MKIKGTVLGYMLALVLLTIAGHIFHYYYQQNFKPEGIKNFLEKKIATATKRAANKEKLSLNAIEHLEKFKNLDLSCFAFVGDKLVGWSNIQVTPPVNGTVINPIEVRGNQTLYNFILPKKFGDTSFIYSVSLISNYPLENDYLVNGLLGREKSKANWEISTNATQHFKKIILPNQKEHIYLNYNPDDDFDVAPNAIVMVIFYLGVIAFWIGAFNIARTLKIQKNKIGGLMFLLISIQSIFIWFIWGILPYNLYETNIFSPEVYSAGWWAPSLGHLFILTIALTSIVGYLSIYNPFVKLKVPKNLLTRIVVGIVTNILIYSIFLVWVYLVFGLIFNSNINLQITKFSDLNEFTFFAIFILVLISCLSLVSMSAINALAYRLRLPLLGIFVIRFAIAFVAIWWLNDKLALSTKGYEQHYGYFIIPLTIWSVLYLFLVDNYHFRNKDLKLFSLKMLAWGLFFCSGLTGLVYLFNTKKEQTIRIHNSESLLSLQDQALEYEFREFAKAVEESEKFRTAFLKEDINALNGIVQTLLRGKKSSRLNAYSVQNYFINKNKLYQFQPNTQRFSDSILDFIYYCEPTSNPNLYATSAEDASLQYWSPININDYYGNSIGTYVVNLTPINPGETGLVPEILLPTFNNNLNKSTYFYAFYQHGQLARSMHLYPFKKLVPEHDNASKYFWTTGKNGKDLWVEINNEWTMCVVNSVGGFWYVATMFSYLFLDFLVCVFLLNMVRIALMIIHNPRQFRMRFFISFADQVIIGLIAVVIGSVLVIGVATNYFLKKNYQENLTDKLYTQNESIEQSLLDDIKNHQYSNGKLVSQEKVDELAHVYRINISIFDTLGQLQNTSYNQIYDMGLQAPLIDFSGRESFKETPYITFDKTQNIGKLEYLANYSALLNDSNKIIGYFGLAYYDSQKEINTQLNSVVLSVVNIYAVAFIFVTILAMYFSKTLSNTLKFIIGQMRQMSLQNNLLKEWKRKDEIGQLMREYNKMAIKLQISVNKMQQHERDTAWREMAQQIAHEIKNPLTPLKLNIQYLKSLLTRDKDKAIQAAPKMLDVMVDQIDNLAYIASEFSAFAKIPNDKKEIVYLSEIINDAIVLHSHYKHVKFVFSPPLFPMKVYADASHMRRVINNLLLNAIQATEDVDNAEVKVDIWRENDLIHYTVQDNGKGMSDDVKANIFQLHFTTKNSGTGLGLAMCRTMIELANGMISFESELNHGTKFSVVLSVYDGPEY